VLALGAGIGPGRATAGDAPTPAPPVAPAPVPADATPFALSEAHEDQDGEARRADGAAAALLAGAPGRVADPVAAAHAWMDLAERAGTTRLPAPAETAAPTAIRPTDGLWWPTREVAFTRLAALPPAGLATVERRWGERAAADLEVVRASGSRTQLVRLAERAPVTRAGAVALLLQGDLALAQGRSAEAAAAFDRWLRWTRGAPPSARAAVAARWVDACVALLDERGVTLVARRAAGLATIPVAGAGGAPPTPLADRIAAGIEAIRAAAAARSRAEPTGPPPPSRLAVLWERALTDPRLLPAPVADDVGAPTAAVAATGDALVLVTERAARRLDLETGLVAWTYPEPAPSERTWSAAARYRAWETSLRAAVPAGDAVLVVLGDAPPATATTFRHRAQAVTPPELGRETRACLVALGLADGRPRWTTGAPDDADPVLRAADVGVASAPVVVGDRVYVVLSARRAWVESWLACLDLATGRPRFVTLLSRGDSGLVRLGGDERGLVEQRVRAVPHALPPAVHAGEVLVVPGAGYAAGVDAADGRVRWVRALPRYRYEDRLRPDDPPAARAFDARVAPVASGGAWVVAAPDAPTAVALELGTGRLRWVGSVRPRADGDRADAPPLAPDAQTLVGVGALADGKAVVRWAGYDRALELRDLASGSERGLPSFPAWPRREGTAPSSGDDAARGRPWSEGRRLVAARDGTLRTTTWAPAADRAWREDDVRAVVADGSRPLPDGDVLRVGTRFVVVGRARLVVVGDLEAERAALATARDGGPAIQAARACRAARFHPSPLALDGAAARVRGAPPSPELDAAFLAAVEARLVRPGGPLDDRAPTRAPQALGVLDALDAVDALTPVARAAVYARIGRAFVARREGRGLVALVDRFVAWGAAALVDADPAGRVAVRGDLYAAEGLLPFAAETPDGEAALLEREARAAEALAAARTVADLARVADGRPGTVAAFVARARRLGRAFDAGATAEVGAVAADLRSRRIPGLLVATGVATALRAVEADAAGAAGDRLRARTALGEARKAGPAFARTRAGTDGAALDAALRGDHGYVLDDPDEHGVLGYDLPLWGRAGAPTKAALLSATALAPTGPGATPALAHALVRRGLTLEVFDVTAPGPGRPVPTIDAGYAGVQVGDLEPALPRRGVRVLAVTSAGPAERAGLRPDDVVVAVGDDVVATREDLLRRIASAAGRTLVLGVLRDGVRATVAVPVEARPDSERATFASSHAYVRADGRYVVASPSGLRVVEPRTGAATTLWAWDGPGIVRDLVAADGTLFAWTSAGPLRDGVVVAVDAATGVEQWRTAVPGALLGAPRAAGSALVVDARDPDRTFLLDRATGSLRASHLRADPDDDLPSPVVAALAPPPTAVAQGFVHLLRDGASRSTAWLVGVDPASGWPTWSRLVDESAQHAMVRPRLLAGGALVALVTSPDEIRVVRPDLTGALADAGALAIDGARFDRVVWGMLESDSRIAAFDDAVHVVRTSRDRRSSVGTLVVDRRAARDPASEDPSVWHPARRVSSPASRLPDDTAARLWPSATLLEATPDGAWVTVVWHDAGERPVEACTAWWEPDADDRLVVVPLSATLHYPQPPVCVGRHALLRTDEGFRVVPLRAAP